MNQNDFLGKLRDLRFRVITESKEILTKTEENILNEISKLEDTIIDTERNEAMLIKIISILQKYRDSQHLDSVRGEIIFTAVDKCINLLVREINKPVCEICKHKNCDNTFPCVYCKHYNYDNTSEFFEYQHDIGLEDKEEK